MGKKLLTVLGLGAGFILVRHEMQRNPDGSLAKAVHSVTELPIIKRGADAVQSKVGEVVRNQGEAVTDKVADMVKERLFGAAPTPGETPIIEVEAEESQSGVKEN